MAAAAIAGIRLACDDAWLGFSGPSRSRKSQLEQSRAPQHTRRRRKQPLDTVSGPTLSSGQHYPGLVNTGNTCFFNSVLQSLASLPELTLHLSQLQRKAEELDFPTPVLDAVLDLLNVLNSSSAKRQRAIRPDTLTAALASRGRESRGALRSLVTAQQQQDAHELLILLLDALSHERQGLLDELEEHVGNSISHETMSGFSSLLSPHASSAGVEADYLRNKLNKERKMLTGTTANPFEALVAQRTACLVCGFYDVIRHYSQEELSLSVPQTRWGSNGVSIEDCLAEWAQLEPVEWRCWACTVRFNINRISADIQTAGGKKNMQPNVDGSQKSDNAGKLTASARKRMKESRKLLSTLEHAQTYALTEEEFRQRYASAKLVQPPTTPVLRSGATATKQSLLSRSPRILALHLNRSIYAGYGATKNGSRVHFGEYLDLSAMCLSEGGVEADPTKGMNQVVMSGCVGASNKKNAPEDAGWKHVGKGSGMNGFPMGPIHGTTNGSANGHVIGEETRNPVSARAMYRLASLVVHYGGHSFGHYVSYRRLPASQKSSAPDAGLFGSEGEDQWLRISDESVSRCSIHQVLQEGVGAFLLFYERIQSDGPEEVPSGENRKDGEARENASDPTGFSRDGESAPSSALQRVHTALLEGSRRRANGYMQGRCVERWQIASRESTPQPASGLASD